MSVAIRAAESGWVPDWIVRTGIRGLVGQRLREQRRAAGAGPEATRDRHLAAMRDGPIALAPDTANVQHYEVPAEFFRLVLGPHLKYSCGSWETGATSLAEAEEAMLRLTAVRAGVTDGMRVLDLGCGWGSFTLWAARTVPTGTFVAVSNSTEQRRHIEQEVARQGLTNVTVVTADMNSFAPDGRFDRVVSVEMFEHMRNYERLLERVRGWLRPGGRLFVHIFCHRETSYFFEDAGPGDWMARNFFTGGMMPSADLLFAFGRWFDVESHWRVDGRDYERTAEAWLRNLDQRRDEVERALAIGRDAATAHRDAERWRLFFMACAELFGYAGGGEWFVSHYLLSPAGREAGV